MGKAGGAPLDYFTHAAGPAAQPTMILGWVFAAVCIGVCIIIAALLLGAMFHKRPRLGRHKVTQSGPGLNWALSGTAISTAVLFAMAIYALVVLNETAAPTQKPALTITVTGYDWWWEVDYEGFETANEIHIPVGVPVLVKLKSADVIHAFWVPQLAGKTQMIPGVDNQQWLEADKPGIYRGQCTQFCGLQHAHMGFEVVAESKQDFAAWETAQRKIAVTQLLDSAGEKIFMHQCAGCHTVRGTDADGKHAPDLTHLQSRRMIAAETFDNTKGNLMDWVQHAQELKPGARMPDFKLTPQQVAELSAYLEGLK